MASWDGLERRKFPRVNYPCLIVMRHNSQPGPEAILTHTENVSVNGICVILKRPLKLFSLVELELDLLDTESNIKCEGKIVWSVQRKSSEKKKPTFYDTGIELSSLNSTDQERVEEVIKRLIQMGQETPYKI